MIDHEPRVHKAIRKRIKAERKRLGLTQEELGERIGKRKNSISQYERPYGATVPPIEAVVKLAEVFGCSVDYLCGRD